MPDKQRSIREKHVHLILSATLQSVPSVPMKRLGHPACFLFVSCGALLRHFAGPFLPAVLSEEHLSRQKRSLCSIKSQKGKIPALCPSPLGWPLAKFFSDHFSYQSTFRKNSLPGAKRFSCPSSWAVGDYSQLTCQ